MQWNEDMRSPLLLVLALAACGGATKSSPESHLGVAQNLDEARRHDAAAAALEQSAREAAPSGAPADAGCVDPVLADQVSSGGEPLVRWVPCWTRSNGADARLQQAAAQRAEATRHRQRAGELVRAELDACANVSDAQFDTSVFVHVGDILAVSALIDDDRLEGARIRFRRITGLSAEWLRAAITCQQARAAASGWPSTYLAFDPTIVEGASVTVRTDDDALVVDVRAADKGAALVVYARAESLLFPEP